MKPMENSWGVPGAPNPCAVMLMRDSNMASLPSKPDEVMRSAKRAAAACQSNIAICAPFARVAWRIHGQHMNRRQKASRYLPALRALYQQTVCTRGTALLCT